MEYALEHVLLEAEIAPIRNKSLVTE